MKSFNLLMLLHNHQKYFVLVFLIFFCLGAVFGQAIDKNDYKQIALSDYLFDLDSKTAQTGKIVSDGKIYIFMGTEVSISDPEDSSAMLTFKLTSASNSIIKNYKPGQNIRFYFTATKDYAGYKDMRLDIDFIEEIPKGAEIAHRVITGPSIDKSSYQKILLSDFYFGLDSKTIVPGKYTMEAIIYVFMGSQVSLSDPKDTSMMLTFEISPTVNNIIKNFGTKQKILVFFTASKDIASFKGMKLMIDSVE